MRSVTGDHGPAGLVDLFDLDISPSCPIAQPILPNFHLPKQQAGNGLAKIKANLTQPSPELPCTPIPVCLFVSVGISVGTVDNFRPLLKQGQYGLERAQLLSGWPLAEVLADCLGYCFG